MATIHDVSIRAGVTVTTVSRVLNNRGYISETTRKKVHEAMEELNYQPNEVARSLFRKRSNIIGLIVPTIANPFFAALTLQIELKAYENNYKVLICNSFMEQEKEKEYVKMLKSNRVDGIIVGSHTLDVGEFENLNYPIVTFDRQIYEYPFVRSDNYQGGMLAASHLIQKGCKHLALVYGDRNLAMFGKERYRGFQEVANTHQMDVVVVETDTIWIDRKACEQSIKQLFDDYPEVDGIFATSDTAAFTVIDVCNQTGRKVPDDVKIVGYDDIELSSMFHPYLTTIRQPLHEMQECAVNTLLKMIDNEDVNRDNTFPVTIVERETT